MSAGTTRDSAALTVVPAVGPSRWVLAVLLPVGPAAVGVLRYVLPYFTTDSPAAVVSASYQHPGSQSAVLWLGYVAILTLVPGVLAAAQVSRPAAPRLTGWSVALIVPAYLSLGGLLSSDALLWSGHRAGVPAETIATVLDAPHPTVTIAIGVYVVGHVVGTVLLGLALVRSGRIPVWAGWAVAVSQPVHLLAAVVIGSPTLDLIAWLATALGMATVARTLVRAQPAGE